MLSTHSERPRELKWYHAGPMLYGDWGTSRFYVLGLAFYYTLHASFWYVLGVGLIVGSVGWAYTVICRCYPDGGGVYSAAKHTSRQLAVVGALLLFADYIVTAAISAYSGMQYLNISNNAATLALALTGLILLIGVVNYIGARKAGTFALIVALMTLVLTLVIGVFALPELGAGWSHIVSFKAVPGSAPVKWDNLVRVILALSGVEAVANMTGIMVPPVPRTSKKSIYPVLIEVVVLNLLFAVAMNALPNAGARPAAEYEPAYNRITAFEHWETNPQAQAEMQKEGLTVERINRDQDIENTVMRVMATDYSSKWLGSGFGSAFGWICGIVFGLLLFSAVNTAVMDMISIQYVMSRDTELPKFMQKLNRFGVPWLALVPAVVLPSVLVVAFPDLVTLGDLYAIGVIGAITINLGSCNANRAMPLKLYERVAMGVLAAVLLAVELTLVWEKPKARWFALFVLCAGLAARFFTKTYPRLSFRRRGITLVTWAGLLIAGAGWVLHSASDIAAALQQNVTLFRAGESAHYCTYLLSSILLMAGGASGTYGMRYLSGKVAVPAPPAALAELRAGAAAVSGAAEAAAAQSHVLVATRGGPGLLEFAANYCRKTDAAMYVLFVRQVNVALTGGGDGARRPEVSEDAEAVRAFALAAEICRKADVKMMPIYVVSPDVAYTILDFAATYGVEAVLMGVSRVGAMLRALRGDVITAVADNLPEDISLLIHA